MVSPFLVLFLSLPLINISYQSIEVYPNTVKYYNSTVISIRPDYAGSTCSQEATLTILSEIPNALKNHRDAVIRFIGEYGYDEILNLKLSISENGIIPIYARNLPGKVGGRTSTLYTQEGEVLEIWIEIGCDVAYTSPNYRQAIILHEIYHALGLGHTLVPSTIELMNGLDRNSPPYPSSLDLYALWQLWFGNLQAESVRLPPNIPYVQVLPYNFQMSQIESSVRQLQFTIDNDIKRIYTNINSLRSDVNNLIELGTRSSVEINDLRTVTDNLVKNQESLKSSLTELENRLSVRDADLLAKITGLRNEAENQAVEINSLKKEIENLNLQLKLFTVALFVAVLSLSLLVFRRRGG